MECATRSPWPRSSSASRSARACRNRRKRGSSASTASPVRTGHGVRRRSSEHLREGRKKTLTRKKPNPPSREITTGITRVLETGPLRYNKKHGNFRLADAHQQTSCAKDFSAAAALHDRPPSRETKVCPIADDLCRDRQRPPTFPQTRPSLVQPIQVGDSQVP